MSNPEVGWFSVGFHLFTVAVRDLRPLSPIPVRETRTPTVPRSKYRARQVSKLMHRV